MDTGDICGQPSAAARWSSRQRGLYRHSLVPGAASEADQLAERDILYLALTRPALTWGVPIEALAINVMICFVAGAELSGPTIWRSPMMFWALCIPIHFGLRRLTSWDYHWARTVRLWVECVMFPAIYSLPVAPAKSHREVSSSV